MDRVRRDAWESSMREAIQTDPAVYADAVDLAKRTEQPVDFAQRNPDFLRQIAMLRSIREQKIESTNPSLYSAMQSLHFAKLAIDDVPNLAFYERWSQGWTNGRLTVERGRAATKVMFGDASGIEELEKANREIAKQLPVSGMWASAGEIVGQFAQSIPKAIAGGTVAGTTYASIAAVGSAVMPLAEPISVPAAFVSGFGVGATTTLAIEAFQVEAGNAYADMVQAGYDPSRSKAAAVGIGLVNAALEVVGAKYATGALRATIKKQVVENGKDALAKMANNGFLRAAGVEMVKNVGGETGTEVAEEVVTILGEYAAKREGDVDLTPELASRLWEVASKTVQGMTLLSVPGSAIAGRNAKVLAMKAKQLQELLGGQIDATQQSKMAQRSPGEVAIHVKDANERNGVPRTVFVDAATMATVLQQADKASSDGGKLEKSAADQIESVLPGFKEQLEQAEKNGGDVELPTEGLTVQLAAASPELAKKISEHARPEPGAPPPSEAGAVLSESAAMTAEEEIYAAMEAAQRGQNDAKARGELMRVALAKAGVTNEADQGRYVRDFQKRDEAAKWAESRAKVEDTIAQEMGVALKAAESNVTAEQRRAGAKAATLMVEQFARLSGKDPETFFAENRLQFGIGMQPGALQQPATLKTDTPEFQAWFGESKVVDAEGKPLVVYHGTTTAGFDAFDLSLGAPGLMGTGLYFTEDPSVASSYADKPGADAAGVYPVTLSIKRPLYADEKVSLSTEQIHSAVAPIVEQWTGDSFADVIAGTDFERINAGGDLTGDGLIQAFKAFLKNDLGFRSDEASDAVRDAVQAAGFDGIVHTGGGRKGRGHMHRVWIALDAKQIKSVNNRGTFDPNDPNILRQPARGGFDPDSLTVLFTKKADATTILHELSHMHTVLLLRLAAQPDAAPQLVADRDTLFKRWGVADQSAWDALSDEQRAKHLEDFAYNAEDYFARGIAPSKELRPLFQRIKAWIVSIYRDIVRGKLNEAYKREFGTDLPALTPELVAIFDRMLASQQAIDIAMAEREGAIEFAPEMAKELGISPEDVAQLKALDEQRRAEAGDELDAEALRATTFYEGSRKRAEAGVKAERAKEVEKARAEAEDEVAAQPVYAAMTFVQSGEVQMDDGTMKPAKLNRDAVKSILGDDYAKLPKGMTERGGVNPDHIGMQFGFGGGDAMLRAFLDAPPMAEAVERLMNEKLAANQDSLTDPKNFRRALERAMHGKSAMRYVSTILRALLRGSRSTPALEAAAREAARVTLDATPVGRISPRAYSAAEVRAMKQAREALKSGDQNVATDAMRKSLLQHFLTRLSIDIEKEVDGFLDGERAKAWEADETLIAQRRNMDYVTAARMILAKFGLATPKQAERASEYWATLAQRNPDEFDKLKRIVNDSTANAKDWASVKLDAFRVMAADVTQLLNESRAVNQGTYDGQSMLKAEAQAQLLEQGIVALEGKNPVTYNPQSDKGIDMASAKTVLTRIEHWTKKLDGGKDGGPWHRYVYRTLRKALTGLQTEQLSALKWWQGQLKKFDRLHERTIDASKWLGTGATWRDRAHLISAIVQTGTESGMRNMILGHAWGEQKADGTLVTQWNAMLDAYKEDGTLTQADFDLVQGIWNYIEETLRGPLQDMSREVYGQYFKVEEARPVYTPFGMMRGGYFPSKVDMKHPANRELAQKVALQSIGDGMATEFREGSKSVPAGVLIARKNNVVRPRVLDLELVGEHLDSTLRLIHLQKALKDVQGLFRGPLLGWLNAMQPTAVDNIVGAALGRMARGQVTAPSDLPSVVIDTAVWLRQSASRAYLALNPRNAAQQFTGILNAVPDNGWERQFNAVWAVSKNPAKAFATVRGESEFMTVRWDPEMQAVQQDIAQMLNPSTIAKLNNWTNRYGFVLQRVTQMMTDASVWLAAKDKAVAELTGTMPDEKVQAEAVQRADSVVRTTQGERSSLDVAKFFAGNAVQQLFTQFGDYPNLVLNQIMSAPSKQRAAVIMMALVLPTFAAAGIALAMSGGRVAKGARADSDDEWYEEWAKYFFGQQLRGALAMVPVAGGAISNALTEARADERTSAFPAWDMVETLLRSGPEGSLWNGDFTERDAKDAAKIMGMLFGVPTGPIGNAWGFAERVEAGKSNPQTPWDYVTGVLSGR
jgi:hypothetical protein